MSKLALEQLREQVRFAVRHHVAMARTYHRVFLGGKRQGLDFHWYYADKRVCDAFLQAARNTKRALHNGEPSLTDKRRLAVIHARYSGGAK